LIATGGVSNVISQGDSNVTVTDVGTGVIQFTVDGTLITQIQDNRMDFQQTDIFGVESLTFDEGGTSTVTISKTANTLTTDFSDNSNIFNIAFQTVVGLSVDLLRTRLFSNTPNTVSAALSLFRDDPSPSINDAVGDINFDGRDSAGNFTTYADILGGIVIPTTNIEEGRLTFRLQDSGVMQQALRVSLTELEMRTIQSDGPTLVIRNDDQTPTGGSNGPKLFFNANDSLLAETTYGSIIVNTTSVLDGFKNATMEFRNMATNSLDPFMNFLGANDKINMFKFLDMNNNFIEFDDIADPGAPASTERRLFSDSGNSAHLTIRTDTGTIDLEGAGSGANQQLSNLTGTTAVNLDLNLGSNALTFDNGVVLSTTGAGLRTDLASGDSFRIFTASVQSHFFSSFINNIIRTSTGALGPILQLTLDSSSPADDDILGTLVYGGRDSAMLQLKELVQMLQVAVKTADCHFLLQVVVVLLKLLL